jgi:hypothetical protein
LPKKSIIVILVILFAFFLIGVLNSGDRGESTVDESVPLEEVRGQASDAFLTNDEGVEAADIEVGLG